MSQTNSEIIIAPYDGTQETANQIAAHHLAIRMHQHESGQNWLLPGWETRILDSQIDLTAITTTYIKPGGNFWVAKDSGGDIAGFVGIKPTNGDEAELKRLGVLPAFRRRRIGSYLVAAAVDWAYSSRFSRINLTTGDNENGVHIYSHLGFVSVGRDDDLNDIHMALDVDSTMPSKQ